MHLYSIQYSRKFHNFDGAKRMTDSKRLTLVLSWGKSINAVRPRTFFNNWDCLRVPPCIRIYHQLYWNVKNTARAHSTMLAFCTTSVTRAAVKPSKAGYIKGRSQGRSKDRDITIHILNQDPFQAPPLNSYHLFTHQNTFFTFDMRYGINLNHIWFTLQYLSVNDNQSKRARSVSVRTIFYLFL